VLPLAPRVAVIVTPRTTIVTVTSTKKKSSPGELALPSITIWFELLGPLLKLLATPVLRSWLAHTVSESPPHVTPLYVVVDRM
jgi:hypothetical protein